MRACIHCNLQSQLGLLRCGKPSGRGCTVLRSFAPCREIDSSRQVPRVGDFLGYGDFTLETTQGGQGTELAGAERAETGICTKE